VLSQEDKPKRHRSAREISNETATLRSRIIHCDLWTVFMTTVSDRTYHAHRFLFSFTF